MGRAGSGRYLGLPHCEPLQRPKDLAERRFFTDEEAAESGAGANDRRVKFFQALAESEAETEMWFDVGNRPADGNRTALFDRAR